MLKETNNQKNILSQQVVGLLLRQGLHISMAESCTGGLLAAAIVSVADASRVFDASFVTYANEAKCKYLGVREETIAQYGVVSEEVAGQMAKGAALANGAEVGVGISGIAGPSGGSPEKPVGTVAFGFSVCGVTTTRLEHFPDTGRQGGREAATLYALQYLADALSQTT